MNTFVSTFVLPAVFIALGWGAYEAIKLIRAHTHNAIIGPVLDEIDAALLTAVQGLEGPKLAALQAAVAAGNLTTGPVVTIINEIISVATKLLGQTTMGKLLAHLGTVDANSWFVKKASALVNSLLSDVLAKIPAAK